MERLGAKDGTVLFSETQKFDQLWLKILMSAMAVFFTGLVLYGLYEQILMGRPFGNKPLSNPMLLLINIFILACGVGLPLGLLAMKLETVLTQDQLRIRFWPLSKRTYQVAAIEDCEAVAYSPIRDYGGWGVRYSLKKGHWIFNVKGDRGALLELKDGSSFMIGSQRPGELARAVKQAIGKHAS